MAEVKMNIRLEEIEPDVRLRLGLSIGIEIGKCCEKFDLILREHKVNVTGSGVDMEFILRGNVHKVLAGIGGISASVGFNACHFGGTYESLSYELEIFETDKIFKEKDNV
jgi:hypothetical protein